MDLFLYSEIFYGIAYACMEASEIWGYSIFVQRTTFLNGPIACIRVSDSCDTCTMTLIKCTPSALQVYEPQTTRGKHCRSFSCFNVFHATEDFTRYFSVVRIQSRSSKRWKARPKIFERDKELLKLQFSCCYVCLVCLFASLRWHIKIEFHMAGERRME